MDNNKPKLCVNMDCERYPPDWDFEEDTEENYQEGEWKKTTNACQFNGESKILFPNVRRTSCQI